MEIVHEVQCSPFIILFLGSIRMDSVISELCYGREILQRNYRKMSILYGHFPIITFVKLHGKGPRTVLMKDCP